MTLQEAIKAVKHSNGELWFRPVSWKRARVAYTISYNGSMTEFVPTHSGGKPQMTSWVSELEGDWEIVTPDQVLNGE